ncbi:MAG: gamma-glutamyltransferase [Melioribacteraceae bacterium]|nr:gamma-glutamyltransferase [Melioribacteraceae bacterium]MCF8264925.1 gamma-glutamyltransferase [Melioribacteraceae bacterium]
MLMRISSKLILIVFIQLLLISTTHSRDPVRAKNGMVVSANQIASEIGVEILKSGGNAIDAAVAVGFALAVVHPSAGNLGGGGLMVIHLQDGFSTTLDFRERAPNKSFRDMFLNSEGEFAIDKSTQGSLSVGVPGTVAGLIYALEKYGTLDLSEVLKPAIALAENGFLLNYRLADFINAYNEYFTKYESSRKIFTNDGYPLVEGQLFVQEDLAKSLKTISEFGLEGFYEGMVADLLVEQMLSSGGIITHQDLKDYEVKEREPLIGSYRNNTVIAMPPPSSGGIGIIQMLNVLENAKFDSSIYASSDYIHTLSETFKYFYADRSKHIGDMDYYDVPVNELISKDYAKEIFSKITPDAIPASEILPTEFSFQESEETTHYSILDINGNAVSVTTTLNSSFGNKIVVEGAGFLLNNEMDDFSAKPGEPNQFGLIGSEANSIAPGKRMLSSMSPTIILKDNKPFLIIGAPGGSKIITSVFQVILNVIDFEMNLQDAVDAPRIHHQWFPDRIDYEAYGLSSDVKQNLIRRGHSIGEITIIGRVNAILFDQEANVFWGASDPRGFGMAVGY